MLAASGGDCESRVASESFIFHCCAEVAPIVVVAAHDCDPVVVILILLILACRLINAVRREHRVGVSDSFADSGVYGVVENRGAEKMNRAFRLGLIDVLAFAGAAPII